MKVEIRIVGQITDENYAKLNKQTKETLKLFDSYKFNFEENKAGK